MANAFPLEPVEKGSSESLKALQLERLQWSLRHAYENVAHYRKKFDAASAAIAKAQSELDDAEEKWLALEMLREEIESGV